MSSSEIVFIDSSCCELTETGLAFTRDPSKEEWQSIWDKVKGLDARLDRQKESVRFWMADLLAFRERRWNMYDHEIERLGLTKQALADLRYVAVHVESSRRREHLSFSHHREVAPLSAEKQTKYLNWAETKNMSRNQLRAAIKKTEQSAVNPPGGDGEKPVKEVIEEEEEPGKKEHTIHPVSDAILFAGMAISQLERIRDDDPKRLEGIQEVRDWCNKETVEELIGKEPQKKEYHINGVKPGKERRVDRYQNIRPKPEVVSNRFVSAFENMQAAIRNEKALEWKETSIEDAEKYVQFLLDEIIY